MSSILTAKHRLDETSPPTDMMTTEPSRPGRGFVAAIATVLLLGSLLVGFFGIGSPKSAAGNYWWTWPSYPYLHDQQNMYGFRDMEFWWVAWTSNYTYANGVYTYLQISSLNTYHDNWGTIGSSNAAGTSHWAGYKYVNSSSGLQYWASSAGSWYNLQVIYVGTATCKSQAVCASAGTTDEGAYLGAAVYQGQTTATCSVKKHPEAFYC